MSVVNAIKLGHLELTVRDLPRMAEFYREVVGLAETAREPDTVHLSTAIDHSSLVLHQDGATGLATIALQVAPLPCADIAAGLQRLGLMGEPRLDSRPGIPELVRTRNTDGMAVDLYPAAETCTHAYTHRGICPLKLPHVACLSPNVNRLVAFYTDVLGFRVSDSMQDFLYFLRCNPDHHTVNMVGGRYAAVQHMAFELTDVGHTRTACDVLARHGTEVLWGAAAARLRPQPRHLPHRPGRVAR